VVINLTHPFDKLTIEYNAENGNGPYKFEWKGPDGFEKNIETSEGRLKGLTKGKYTVTLTDKNGEKVETSIDISGISKDTTVIFPKATLYSVENENETFPLGIRLDVVTKSSVIDKAILPSPWAVLSSFKELHFENYLVKNTILSIKLNVLGYIEAIVLSLIIGFIIGLIPFFRSLWRRYIDAIRFVPLAAVTGLFIAWFGIYMEMKVPVFGFWYFCFPCTGCCSANR